MASGRLDLLISRIPVNTLIITLNHSESQELLAISQTSPITLQRGKLKQIVHVKILEGREFFADFVEMNPSLVRRFKLIALRRYLLVYNQTEQILTIEPSPISSSQTSVAPSKITFGRISIGYELICKLGIPERPGMLLKVIAGAHQMNLRLLIPANLSDERISLANSTMQKFKISTNQHLGIQYDQRNSSLQLSPMK